MDTVEILQSIEDENFLHQMLVRFAESDTEVRELMDFIDEVCPVMGSFLSAVSEELDTEIVVGALYVLTLVFYRTKCEQVTSDWLRKRLQGRDLRFFRRCYASMGLTGPAFLDRGMSILKNSPVLAYFCAKMNEESEGFIFPGAALAVEILLRTEEADIGTLN